MSALAEVPGRLEVLADGRVVGEAHFEYNDPFPCVNGTPGGGSPSMMGVVMHTNGKGTYADTVAWFNTPGANASAFFEVGLDGIIHQFGPVGHNWEAWAQVDGNPDWYSIEHADDGVPLNPLTDKQVRASAQLVEVLSRFAGFPLQVSDDVNTKGYGVHYMGGAAWGGHPCPLHVRAAQRGEIIALAKLIRHPVTPPPPPDLEGVVVLLPGGISRKVLSRDGGRTWA